ncbi:ion transporter [Crocinitomicaceae bacterium CZZ-1]|uniref:Ion transporter n=1 Tax=Taishania pollutisoli TaxID=2766479 RepID=A0A8J6PBS4_9FLAO|nr:ion transporter [Taishania pollutisoli]MBC9812283.1 ion transporter [Taishania pollutisoli]MBX2950261.1 ion transporter [Crocinitomicaceae bacterium]NGF74269.1 ion transporter [Fluviicola sp. SGL-29]
MSKETTKLQKEEAREAFKKKVYSIMFETSTPQGKKFDLLLLAMIVFSLFILIIESLPSLSPTTRLVFYILEWILSIIFVGEYLLRIYVSPKPMQYVLSAWGIIDLLSILPVLLLAFTDSVIYFRIIRILRLIRIFRIFRINQFTREAYSLYNSLIASVYKIAVFMFFVVMLAIIMGGLMFMVEGKESGFDSIPESIYWAIVTITTVGFGDITPLTDAGKALASVMMLLGYAIIAVPTGIVSVEMFKQRELESKQGKQKCPQCDAENSSKAVYCNQCGNKLVSGELKVKS